MYLGQQRSGGHRDHRVLGNPPGELLDDFKAHALGTFGVIGPHVDIHKGPAVFPSDFSAKPVHFIVVAFDPDDLGAVNQRVHHLALFEVGGNKDVGLQSGSGGVRGDGVGQIAGRSAGDGGETQLARAAQRHTHHPIFERKRRIIDRIVLDPQLAHAESPRQAVGSDQRREADLEADGRFARHRQQLGVAPHRLRSRLDRRPGERCPDAIVIVKDFERAEVKFAHVRGGQRIFAAALTTLERLHETCVFFHNLILSRDAPPACPCHFEDTERRVLTLFGATKNPFSSGREEVKTRALLIFLKPLA